VVIALTKILTAEIHVPEFFQEGLWILIVCLVDKMAFTES
jgi:hypothetical protein